MNGINNVNTNPGISGTATPQGQSYNPNPMYNQDQQYNQVPTPAMPPMPNTASIQTEGLNPEVPASTNTEAIKMPEVSERSVSSEQVKSEKSNLQETHLLPANNNVPAPMQNVQTQQDSLDIVGVKLYGYKFSTQLANMKNKFMSMSGKGNPAKSKSWLIMLLDRLLKIESMKKV